MGLGPPKNRGDYSELAIDGVTVYWPRGLDAPYSFTVKVHSLFGFKTLSLEGWKII